jgi:hypothetical protein
VTPESASCCQSFFAYYYTAKYKICKIKNFTPKDREGMTTEKEGNTVNRQKEAGYDRGPVL